MVGYIARNEARASVDHRRIADARVLAAMESAYDRASTQAREESGMSNVELPSRQEVEDLLYKEAALLDEWRLEEWLELLTQDAIYEVPPTDVPEGDSRNTLFIIADDAVRIRSRVKQLLGKAAWSENPRSRTRRMIANVRVVGADGDSILVTANFAVHRMRYESVDTYIGHYDYKLVRAGAELRIRERRAILDNEALRPHGKISFIL
jgi:p-cumate 2,3-dioxygenase subunit beta